MCPNILGADGFWVNILFVTTGAGGNKLENGWVLFSFIRSDIVILLVGVLLRYGLSSFVIGFDVSSWAWVGEWAKGDKIRFGDWLWAGFYLGGVSGLLGSYAWSMFSIDLVGFRPNKGSGYWFEVGPKECYSRWCYSI